MCPKFLHLRLGMTTQIESHGASAGTKPSEGGAVPARGAIEDKTSEIEL